MNSVTSLLTLSMEISLLFLKNCQEREDRTTPVELDSYLSLRYSERCLPGSPLWLFGFSRSQRMTSLSVSTGPANQEQHDSLAACARCPENSQCMERMTHDSTCVGNYAESTPYNLQAELDASGKRRSKIRNQLPPYEEEHDSWNAHLRSSSDITYQTGLPEALQLSCPYPPSWLTRCCYRHTPYRCYNLQVWTEDYVGMERIFMIGVQLKEWGN